MVVVSVVKSVARTEEKTGYCEYCGKRYKNQLYIHNYVDPKIYDNEIKTEFTTPLSNGSIEIGQDRLEAVG